MKKLLTMCLLALSFTAQSQNVTISQSKTGYIIDLAIIHNTDEGDYYFQYRDLTHPSFLSYEKFKVSDLQKLKTDFHQVFSSDQNNTSIVIDGSTILEVSKFKAQLYKWANVKVITNSQVTGLFSVNKRDLKKIFR